MDGAVKLYRRERSRKWKAAMLYNADDPDRLLGGGWITAAPRKG
ncbi:MAG: hypothetical protein P8N97_01240 [Alphaproteobacteria bacterium]|jgi:hypothetical protein|nr:hypothetical protein [Alphaproteobacteria bacterium]